MDSDKVAAEKVKRGQRVKVKRLTAWVHFSLRVEVNGGSRGPQPLGPNA